MISEEITADLKKGLSIDEVLTKHNTNLKELFKHPENPNLWLNHVNLRIIGMIKEGTFI